MKNANRHNPAPDNPNAIVVPDFLADGLESAVFLLMLRRLLFDPSPA